MAYYMMVILQQVILLFNDVTKSQKEDGNKVGAGEGEGRALEFPTSWSKNICPNIPLNQKGR